MVSDPSVGDYDSIQVLLMLETRQRLYWRFFPIIPIIPTIGTNTWTLLSLLSFYSLCPSHSGCPFLHCPKTMQRFLISVNVLAFCRTNDPRFVSTRLCCSWDYPSVFPVQFTAVLYLPVSSRFNSLYAAVQIPDLIWYHSVYVCDEI